jgi:hypothetical protein
VLSKKFEKNRKEIPDKVEVDTELMIKIHEKLVKEITVDKDVVSNLLLGGVINILNQHDTIDDMSNRMKAVEESSLTDKIRLEALENFETVRRNQEPRRQA